MKDPRVFIVVFCLLLSACAPEATPQSLVPVLPTLFSATTESVVYGEGRLSVSEVDSDTLKPGFQEGCIITLQITIPDPETVANKKFTVVTDKGNINLYPSRETEVIPGCTYNDAVFATIQVGKIICEGTGKKFACPEGVWK